MQAVFQWGGRGVAGRLRKAPTAHLSGTPVPVHGARAQSRFYSPGDFPSYCQDALPSCEMTFSHRN